MGIHICISTHLCNYNHIINIGMREGSVIIKYGIQLSGDEIPYKTPSAGHVCTHV